MSESFTNEEILFPGIDVRIIKHRMFLLRLQEERQQTGESFGEQIRRYELEGRAIPDSRSRSGTRVAELSIGEYIERFQRVYIGITIRFIRTFTGGQGIRFIGKDKLTLEMFSEHGGEYTIVQVDGSIRTGIYSGNPQGAIRVINEWYKG